MEKAWREKNIINKNRQQLCKTETHYRLSNTIKT